MRFLFVFSIQNKKQEYTQMKMIYIYSQTLFEIRQLRLLKIPVNSFDGTSTIGRVNVFAQGHNEAPVDYSNFVSLSGQSQYLPLESKIRYSSLRQVKVFQVRTQGQYLV